jgi:DNA-binding NarL/FixJ family response regulator
MKLLIVDDHAGVRTMIRQLAALPDEAVRECASGEAALHTVREFEPDIVTMDVRLPGLSGLEATRAIRASHPATQVVVVSAYDQPTLRSAAQQAGAFAFVPKDNLEKLRPLFARITPANNATQAPASPAARFPKD